MRKYVEKDAWKIIESTFVPENALVTESLFSTGNGFMGIRGNFEEGYGGETLPGSYFAGIYYPDKTRVGWWKNGYPEYFAKVLNSVNWIECKISANGESLDFNSAKISDYLRVLDLQKGILTRSFTWQTKSGKLDLWFSRFCSFSQPNLGVIELTITSNSFQGEIAIQSGLDFDVRNQDSNYDEVFWEPVGSHINKYEMSVCARTKKTNFVVVSAADVELKDWNCDTQFIRNKQYAGCQLTGKLSPKQKICLIKRVANQSSFYVNPQEVQSQAIALLHEFKAQSVQQLKELHVQAWERKWQEVDIQIEGDVSAQQGIRYNIFQLLQTYRGDDPRLNIGPKGFTGEKYGGSTYWDTEAYCLPFYYHSCGKTIARQLLLYRYNHLEKAIENAEKLGFDGGAALYPMVTMNGEECHNEWEITFEEIHRNGAIVYAIFFYLNATGDKEYVYTYGLPVIISIARFWYQRMNYSQEKKKYVILGVTGPNEYENNVNNNWYTNYMAKWCLQFALDQLSELKTHSEIKYQTFLSEWNLGDEMDQWIKVIPEIYLPLDSTREVFLQQDGFLDKELKTVSQIPESQIPLNQNWSWDRILRSCYIKQADVLQGLFFFPDHFSKSEIKRNFEFYEPMTVHESSLSPCVHSILAARLGDMKKSYELYLKTSRLDLDNYNQDTEDGLHITSMAGTWMSIVYGFAGLQIRNQDLYLYPQLPPEWKKLTFTILYHEVPIRVWLTEDEVKIQNFGDKRIQLFLFEQSFQIDHEEILAVPMQILA